MTKGAGLPAKVLNFFSRIPETITALLLIPAHLLRKKHLSLSRTLKAIALATGVGVFAALLYGFTWGYQRVVVKEFTYTGTKVPPTFDGYKIVQISDLHLGTLHGRANVVERLVDSINACRADLVVFTGDLVNYKSTELFEFEHLLQNIRARDGVVSVMGNHDYAQYFHHASPTDSLADITTLQEHQRKMGWKLLLNENLILRRATDSIAIIGVENNGRPPFPALADLNKAQKGLQENIFKILLSHDPSHWRQEVLPETNIDLTLSGHTHGMQFKLGDFSPASWFYPEWGGSYTTPENRCLYVSLGAGAVMLPFRLGAWPEINLITLKHKD